MNRYNFEVACGIRLIEEYRALEPFIVADPMEAYTHPILILKCLGDSGRDTSLTVNSYIRQTRGKYWRAIFQQKTFTEKLTGNLLQELYDNVRQLMDYDFSVYNILTLVIKMNAKVVGGIEDTIVELFDDWTRKSWNEDKEAFAGYFEEAKEEGYVRITRVGSILSETSGVLDYTNLKINQGTANIPIAVEEYPGMGDIELVVSE